MEEKEYVYVLQLTQGRFYVGYTQSLSYRIAQHFSGQGGAKFTTKYPPERVLSVIEAAPGNGRALESATYAALACQYGWERVRGAGHCQVEMTKPPQFLRKLEAFSAAQLAPKPKKDMVDASSPGEADQSPIVPTHVGVQLMEDRSPLEGSGLCGVVCTGKVHDEDLRQVVEFNSTFLPGPHISQVAHAFRDTDASE